MSECAIFQLRGFCNAIEKTFSNYEIKKENCLLLSFLFLTNKRDRKPRLNGVLVKKLENSMITILKIVQVEASFNEFKQLAKNVTIKVKNHC